MDCPLLCVKSYIVESAILQSDDVNHCVLMASRQINNSKLLSGLIFPNVIDTSHHLQQ